MTLQIGTTVARLHPALAALTSAAVPSRDSLYSHKTLNTPPCGGPEGVACLQSELTGVKSQLADSSREVQRLDSELSAARSNVTDLKSRITELMAQVRGSAPKWPAAAHLGIGSHAPAVAAAVLLSPRPSRGYPGWPLTQVLHASYGLRHMRAVVAEPCRYMSWIHRHQGAVLSHVSGTCVQVGDAEQKLEAERQEGGKVREEAAALRRDLGSARDSLAAAQQQLAAERDEGEQWLQQ